MMKNFNRFTESGKDISQIFAVAVVYYDNGTTSEIGKRSHKVQKRIFGTKNRND